MWKTITTGIVLVLSSNVYALPNPAASYSVVDVDGGSGHQTAGVIIKPTTVYETVTTTASASPVSISTVTITNQETQTTTIPVTASVTVLQTENFTTTMYATASVVAIVTETVTALSTTTATTLEQFTTTSIESTSKTSTTYDDGMWHTHYPVLPTTTASTFSTTYLGPAVTSTASGTGSLPVPSALASAVTRRRRSVL